MQFNGIDPRTLDPRISIAKEIPPGAPASKLETISGSEGEVVVGRTIKQAEYTVRINVASRTRAGAWEIREKLAAWARATDTVPRQLIPTHRPDVYYDAVFKEISDPEFSFGFGVITVVFALPRPIARSLILKSAGASDADGAGVVREFSVGGTSYARPEFEITTKDADRLELMLDGTVYAAIDRQVYEGDLVIIKTDPPGVTWRGLISDQYIDYTVTDLDALALNMTPSTHTYACAQANRVRALWREEYL